MMIVARTRANLSVAIGLSETVEPLERLSRPSSAPTTQGESKQARRHILSLDPSKEKQKQEREMTPRPRSCLANFRH